MIGLVRPFLGNTDVSGLLVGQFGQLRVELLQLQAGNLLVQVLRQGVYADRVFAGIMLAPQLDLSNGLVRKGGTHHIRWMARAATQIDQAAFCQQNDAFSVREDDMIHLRLDFFPLVFFNRRDFDFVVEMTDVANNGLVFHLHHMVMGDDMVVAGAGYEDVGLVGGIVHRHHAVAFHRRLQGANRVDFRHPHLRGQGA